MNSAQLKTKPKSKKINKLHHTSKDGLYNFHASSHSINSCLSPFYSDGPVFNLGTPIQAKLKIGQSNDIYEQEADRVADQVMSMPEPKIQRKPTRADGGPLCRDEGIDEEVVQPKFLPIEITPLIQRQEEPDEEEEIQAKHLFGNIQPLVQRQVDQENEKEEPIQPKPISSQITPLIQRQSEEEKIQTKETSKNLSKQSPNLEYKIHALKGRGYPLPESTRAFFEPRFDYDFSQVCVHTDSKADEAVKSVNAKAFTTGRDVVFGSGQYEPKTHKGRKLLAHELTHVVQQKIDGAAIASNGRSRKFQASANTALVQCQGNENAALAKPQIDYARAEKRNKHYASRLGWDKRLWNIPRGHVLALLWHGERFERFADSVATFQREQGFSGGSVNGVLNPRTWDRLRPVGEVVAKQSANWELSEGLCYEATRVRMERGYKRATGLKLVESEKRNIIYEVLRGNPSRMEKAGIDKRYWGTHAAGALVLLRKGEFVSQSDIWENKLLEPGAVLQVWDKRSDLERIKKGMKPLSSGTSGVFVEYVGENSMRVLHHGERERWKKGEYEVWIGANFLSR